MPQLPKNQKAKKRQKELRYAFGSVLFIFYEEFQFDDQQPEFVFHLLFFRLWQISKPKNKLSKKQDVLTKKNETSDEEERDNSVENNSTSDEMCVQLLQFLL